MDLFISLSNGKFQFILEDETVIEFAPTATVEMAEWLADHLVFDAMCSSSIDFSEEEGVSNARGLLNVVFAQAVTLAKGRRL